MKDPAYFNRDGKQNLQKCQDIKQNDIKQNDIDAKQIEIGKNYIYQNAIP